MNSKTRRFLMNAAGMLMVLSLLAVPMAAFADTEWPGFATPVFGLAASPDGNLYAADAGAGIVRLQVGEGGLAGRIFAELPGVTDIAPIGNKEMFAITGGGDGPTARMLFRVSQGRVRPLADLGAFEAAVNPDGGEIDSNPYDVARLDGGQALIADAGGNDLLIANNKGEVDWIATLPDELVSTANIKELVGCPTAPDPLAFICGLPAMMPAQPVATSVAIGPDGAYYVGELKGFPGPVGVSKIWRIEAGARHAVCGSSPMCSVVADGFTSIVDLSFGPDGTLYVTEIDEASFMAVELIFLGMPGATVGGTVNACDATFNCSEVATQLPLPIATASTKSGQLYAAINSLVPGAAAVIPLP